MTTANKRLCVSAARDEGSKPAATRSVSGAPPRVVEFGAEEKLHRD